MRSRTNVESAMERTGKEAAYSTNILPPASFNRLCLPASLGKHAKSPKQMLRAFARLRKSLESIKHPSLNGNCVSCELRIAEHALRHGSNLMRGDRDADINRIGHDRIVFEDILFGSIV